MKKATNHSKKSLPLVSVIVPTRNSAQYLQKCLSGIINQTYKNIEILVVDNNSKDDTKEIAKKFTNQIFNYGPERTTQVNFGAKKAKGEYLYYTGGDLVADKMLIEEAVEKCEKDNLDAIYLNVLTVLRTPNIWQQVRALERKCYYKEANMSAARFYKRSVFLNAGGLDESMGAVSDDLEFQERLNRLKYKTGFINAKENNYGEYKSLLTIIKRSLYYGMQLTKYIKKYPTKSKTQYSFVRKEFTSHSTLLLKDKRVFVFFIIYKLTQYSFGAFGFFLGKISSNNSKIERFLYEINYSK